MTDRKCERSVADILPSQQALMDFMQSGQFEPVLSATLVAMLVVAAFLLESGDPEIAQAAAITLENARRYVRDRDHD